MPVTTIAPPIDSLDPATGEVIARFAAISPSEVPRIVERARRGQAEWAEKPIRKRCAGIYSLATECRQTAGKLG